MSAFGGILNFDGMPVDHGILIAMGQRLAARGPDGGSQVKCGSVAMVYRAFHTNKQSRLEIQPLLSVGGQVLCFDGRLDNREELISILDDQLRGQRTDVAIVMASYLRWGISFLPKIIGDFALSLWDPTSKSLILARDIIGPRTLYYHRSGRRAIWSTELGLLLDLADILLEINDEYVAGFLTNLPEPEQTPYKNIEGVPPASSVIIKMGQATVSRFWSVDSLRPIRYKTDIEYEEHFRHLFREAVHCRLRVDAPVWAELSGGMDSSSLVCMANDIIKRKDVDAFCLETASRVFDEAAKSDERKFILPVERKIGKLGLHLREDDHRLLAPLGDDYVPTMPNYVANVAEYYKALRRAMRETGSRVLLSGLGGGELLLGDGDPFPELADLLVRGKLLRLHHRLRAWSKAREKTYFRFVSQKLIVPLFPGRLQKSNHNGIEQFLKFYDPTFVARMGLRQRLTRLSEPFGFRCPGARYQSALFRYASRQISAGFWQEISDIEFSYPATHRPLAEFLLAIPIDQKARPNESKSILRRALSDLLPPELINRREGRITIRQAASLAVMRERHRIRDLFMDARSAAYGYLNSAAVVAACNDAGKPPDPQIMFLVPFEYWLRSLDQRRQACASTIPRTIQSSTFMAGSQLTQSELARDTMSPV